MAYLLRGLILLMVLGISLTVALAHGWMTLSMSHIHVAIPAFIYTIFAQAFVMFYFIGVARLVKNVHLIIHTEQNLTELFDDAPSDLAPYKKKVDQWHRDAERSKRQTVPWTMLMLILGMIAFLLGGAHDTNLVEKTIHSGVAYGFIAAMLIGFVRQWYYLGKAHVLLRRLKAQFEIPDAQM